MNRTFKRLVIPVGMAAAISTAGFAFMASNTVAPSSAGEGAAAVTGYTASDISYSTVQCPPQPAASTQTCINGVSFTLTSNATSAPANAQPKDVVVTYKSGNNDLNWSSVHAGTCHIAGWASPGTGTVTCTTGQIGVASLSNLDIEANQ